MKLIVEASPNGAYAFQGTRDRLIHTICDWENFLKSRILLLWKEIQTIGKSAISHLSNSH